MNKNPLFSARPAPGTKFRNLSAVSRSKLLAALAPLLIVALSHGFALQSCTLAWNASSGATGYRLRYGETSGNLNQSVDALNSTTRTVTNLKDATTYYFIVVAYNSAGVESQPSNQVSYKTPGTVSGGYTLTVVNGTGDGTYAPGTSVAVSANQPGAGQQFNVWTGDTAILPAQDLNDPTTTALMPSTNVSITATYKAAVSIWRNGDAPQVADSGPDEPVELGVKFRSDVAGRIIGIRFYKSSANTGRHVANLWTSSGTLLATATFNGETASGWQQVNFATPVVINANTVYVASYHCDSGHYSADFNYFSATSGEDNPPLHAIPSTSSNRNGVYAYGSNSIFPSQSWNSCNYWVDVIFDD